MREEDPLRAQGCPIARGGRTNGDGAGVWAPTEVIETSRKRGAEDAGHESGDADRGGVQPDPGSMADDSMQEATRDAGALGADAVALAEAHSPARFQQRAGAFGLSAGAAMDLRMGWALGFEADQVKARKRLSVEKPHLLILSPTCLAFSQLHALNTKPDRLAELLEQGRHHLEFACSLAGSQVERSGRVPFEHPWAATSWDEPCLKKLLAIDGMRRIR